MHASSKSKIGDGLKKLVTPCITEEETLDLLNIPREEEIRKVVWAMNHLKGPRPDGFSKVFLHVHIGILLNISLSNLCNKLLD